MDAKCCIITNHLSITSKRHRPLIATRQPEHNQSKATRFSDHSDKQLERPLRTTLQTNQPRYHEEETQNTNSHTTARTQPKQGNSFSYLSEMQLERMLITALQTNPPRNHEEETQTLIATRQPEHNQSKETATLTSMRCN